MIDGPSGLSEPVNAGPRAALANAVETRFVMMSPPAKRGLWWFASGAAIALAAAIAALAVQHVVPADRLRHISALLLVALLGGALLIGRLAHRVRSANALARQLAQTNQQLEARMAKRTRTIEEGRALLHFILDASPSEVVLAEAQSGRVHFMNYRLTERLGLTAPPKTLFLHQLLHDAQVGEQLMQALDQYGQVDGMEARIGQHDPHWSSLSARLIEVDGQLAHLLWGFDISTHEELEAQLRELATRDELSGLLNRRAFLERSTALLDHCRRHARPCAALMLDIDHFKRINDQHGHQVGDQAIRACAQAIGSALRDADLLGRLGGEEFAVLLPHSTMADAVMIAERIRTAIGGMNLPTPQGHRLSFTVSIGVAAMAPDTLDIEHLLVNADAALYLAKAAGRNKVQTHVAATRHPHDHIPSSP